VRRPNPELLRAIVFAGALIAVLAVLVALRHVFLPLLLGLTFAYLADPAITWYERRGGSRAVAAIAIAFVVVGLATGFVLYLVPAIGAQVRRLQESLPRYAALIQTQFLPWLHDLQQRFPKPYAEIEARATEALRNNMPQVAAGIAARMAAVFGSALNLFLFLLNLIFVPVFAFYLMVDFPKLRHGARELVPLPYRERVLERAHEIDRTLSSFVRGQLTISAVLAVVWSTGLMALGVPLGLVLGLAAGLANMIPYMWLVIGLLPAALLCWADTQSPAHVLGVVAVFLGGHLTDALFLSPRILSRSVDLHPVWILLAIILGGHLFGLFGMLIAVPTAAVLQVFLHHALASYYQSSLYRGDSPPPVGPG
jgi:predicted PurR-regulated permease PerM